MTTINMSAKLCFVVGPIGEEGSPIRNRSDMLLHYIIQPAMAHRTDFKIKRADQIAAPGMIDGQIIKCLRDAELVIADLATSNPNAFYEIGIRHMVSKPIVHMQEKAERIPFDVSLYSAVLYSLESVKSHKEAIDQLRRHIDAALDANHEVDNPVTRSLGQEKFSQTAMPEIELLKNEISSLRNAVQPLLANHQEDVKRKIVDALMAQPITMTLADLGKVIPDNAESPSGLAGLFAQKPYGNR